MVTEELLTYIQEELAVGQEARAVRSSLIEGGGWDETDLDEAFAHLGYLKETFSQQNSNSRDFLELFQQQRETAHEVEVNPSQRVIDVEHNITQNSDDSSRHVIVDTPAIETPQPLKYSPTDSDAYVGKKEEDVIPYEKAQEVSEEILLPQNSAQPTPAFSLKSLLRPSKTIEPDRALPGAIIADPKVGREVAQETLGDTKSTSTMDSWLSKALTKEEATPPAAPLSTSPSLAQGVALGNALRSPTSKTRKILIGVLSLMVLGGVVGMGAYTLFKVRAPSDSLVLESFYAALAPVLALEYQGNVQVHLAGEVVDPQVAQLELGQTGSLDLSLNTEGAVDTSVNANNSSHQWGVNAQLLSGDIKVGAETRMELRVIAGSWYIKFANPPEIGKFDLNFLKNYWIVVSPRNLEERFGFRTSSEGAYGVLENTGIKDKTFFGALYDAKPFRLVKSAQKEEYKGEQVYHIVLSVNPEEALSALESAYRAKSTNPTALSATERTQYLSLLKDVHIEFWVDQEKFLPRRLLVSHTLKHTISGVSLVGTVLLDQEFSRYNVPIVVSLPKPTMSYDEFSDNIVRQQRALNATGDEKRLLNGEKIIQALDVYHENHQKTYPKTLNALIEDGILKELPVDELNGTSTYVYAAYVVSGTGMLDKKNNCTNSISATSTCSWYHFGVTIDDKLNQALGVDSDLIGDVVKGQDTKGCSGEVGKACYDIAPK